MSVVVEDGLAEIVCLHCATIFRHENPWRGTCSDECRANRRALQARERESTRVRSPIEILSVRSRCARWATENRKCTRSQPWLAGPPPFESHLPGFAQSISLDPLPRWPIALRNTRTLHGALTTILDRGHRQRFPNFSLFPHAGGWAVHWYLEDAEMLPSEATAPLFDVLTRFRFGPRIRFRAPDVSRRARMRLSIEAITPVVVVTQGRSVSHVRPTTDTLIGAIATEFPNRITEDVGWGDARSRWVDWVRERARVEIVSVNTEPAHVPMCGKYGTIHGWTGSVTVDVNATSRWLLGAAERMGLGSRVGFGFGCIRLRHT